MKNKNAWVKTANNYDKNILKEEKLKAKSMDMTFKFENILYKDVCKFINNGNLGKVLNAQNNYTCDLATIIRYADNHDIEKRLNNLWYKPYKSYDAFVEHFIRMRHDDLTNEYPFIY